MKSRALLLYSQTRREHDMGEEIATKEEMMFVGVRLCAEDVGIVDVVAEAMGGTRSEAMSLIISVYDTHIEQVREEMSRQQPRDRKRRRSHICID